MASPPLFLQPDSVYTSCYCEENVYLLAKSFAAEGEVLGRSAPWPWEIYVVFVSNSGKTVALWNQKAGNGVVVWDYHVFLVLRPRPRILPHLGADTSSNLDHATCAPSPHCDVHSASDVQDDCGPNQSPDGDQAWVYDFDTTLAVPCPWREYVAGTFPYAFNDELVQLVDTRFLSLFRVVPADVYLDYFASDRSHMIVNSEMDSASGSDADEVDKNINGARALHGLRYSMPPPPYPPLCGAKARELGIIHNLMESFVAMDIISGATSSVSDGRTVSEDEGTYSAAAGEVATSGASSSLARYGQVMDIGGFIECVRAEVGYIADPDSNSKSNFQDWIPEYLQDETKELLRKEMRTKRSAADVSGYIYAFEIDDDVDSGLVHIKVGRAVRLTKRLAEWDKQCQSKQTHLRGFWPSTKDADDGNLARGRVQVGEPGPWCHKLERLVHLELADLAVNAPYLDQNFPNVKGGSDNGGDRVVSRTACPDCGVVHQEIFSFPRAKGRYKGKEWQEIVNPVIEKWGGFVEAYV